jgi:two-component system sensor histidine kinase DevS
MHMPGDAPGTALRDGLQAADSWPLSDAGLTDEGAWALLDAAPDGVILVDESGLILLVNRQTERLFGYDRADLLGRTVDDLLPEQLRQLHGAHRTRYRVEPRARPMDVGTTLFGRRADGSEFPLEISLSPMRTVDGLRVVAAVRDITDRIEAEAVALRLSETLDALRDAVFIFDAETLRFTHVNQGAVEQVGYPRDELVGMTMLHIAPEFTEATLRALLEPFARGETSSATFTTTHRHRNGIDVPVEVTLEARRHDDGRPHNYITIVRDIADRLEVEQRLRRTEQDLLVSEDRDRIARDLHDRTIQRLFAAGLTLQGAQSRCEEEEVAARLGAVIDDLDDTIRELRSVIFGLHARAGDSGLRSEVLRVIADERPALGFHPRVRFDGLIDAVSDAIANELLPTLREALSNVARHAHASSAEVVLEGGDNVVLRVLDNGIGIADNVVSGNGTRNFATRASILGGECRVTARPEGGTMLEWSVPNRR